MAKPPKIWQVAIADTKERLRAPLWWFPFPAFIAFGLVTLLTAYVTMSTATRTGHPAEVLSFPSEPRNDGPIWFAVTPVGGEIVVTTADRSVFRWKQDARTVEAAAPFVAWLKRRVQEEVEAAALLKKGRVGQTTAVIAADQHLSFVHMRPILYALAEAGISHYGFETINPLGGATLGARAKADHRR